MKVALNQKSPVEAWNNLKQNVIVNVDFFNNKCSNITEEDWKMMLTLKRRLDLFNIFGGVMNQTFVPLTLENIGINMDEPSITRWLLKNNIEMDSIRDFLGRKGTDKQRKLINGPI
jgi:hypothetical protein